MWHNLWLFCLTIVEMEKRQCVLCVLLKCILLLTMWQHRVLHENVLWRIYFVGNNKMSSCKMSDIFVRFVYFLDRFLWKSSVCNFTGILTVGVSLIYVKGQTCAHDDRRVYANTSKYIEDEINWPVLDQKFVKFSSSILKMLNFELCTKKRYVNVQKLMATDNGKSEY